MDYGHVYLSTQIAPCCFRCVGVCRTGPVLSGGKCCEVAEWDCRRQDRILGQLTHKMLGLVSTFISHRLRIICECAVTAVFHPGLTLNGNV